MRVSSAKSQTSAETVIVWLPLSHDDDFFYETDDAVTIADAHVTDVFNAIRADAEPVVTAVKSHSFTLSNGETPFVSASFGAAPLQMMPGRPDANAVADAIRHATAGISESSRIGRNKLHIWDGRRLRRTD